MLLNPDRVTMNYTMADVVSPEETLCCLRHQCMS